MVQVPVQKRWSFPGNPQFTLAEGWLGTTLPLAERLPDLVKRYLAGFGPATVKDIETWSYLSDLQPVVEELRSELVVYRAEHSRRSELFDLPDLPITPSDVDPPARFLPQFHNLPLPHQDRPRASPQPH